MTVYNASRISSWKLVVWSGSGKLRTKLRNSKLSSKIKGSLFIRIGRVPSFLFRKGSKGCRWVSQNQSRWVRHTKPGWWLRGTLDEYGLSYEETLAPVAKFRSNPFDSAVAAARKWPMYQHHAFLHFMVKVEEERTMDPPPWLPISS